MSIENGDGADEPAPEVSRERAKELIDAAEAGSIVVLESEPVPVLGELDDPDDAELDLVVNTYKFGDIDEFGFGETDDGGDAP